MGILRRELLEASSKVSNVRARSIVVGSVGSKFHVLVVTNC